MFELYRLIFFVCLERLYSINIVCLSRSISGQKRILYYAWHGYGDARVKLRSSEMCSKYRLYHWLPLLSYLKVSSAGRLIRTFASSSIHSRRPNHVPYEQWDLATNMTSCRKYIVKRLYISFWYPIIGSCILVRNSIFRVLSQNVWIWFLTEATFTNMV